MFISDHQYNNRFKILYPLWILDLACKERYKSFKNQNLPIFQPFSRVKNLQMTLLLVGLITHLLVNVQRLNEYIVYKISTFNKKTLTTKALLKTTNCK